MATYVERVVRSLQGCCDAIMWSCCAGKQKRAERRVDVKNASEVCTQEMKRIRMNA